MEQLRDRAPTYHLHNARVDDRIAEYLFMDDERRHRRKPTAKQPADEPNMYIMGVILRSERKVEI